MRYDMKWNKWNIYLFIILCIYNTCWLLWVSAFSHNSMRGKLHNVRVSIKKYNNHGKNMNANKVQWCKVDLNAIGKECIRQNIVSSFFLVILVSNEILMVWYVNRKYFNLWAIYCFEQFLNFFLDFFFSSTHNDVKRGR